MPARPELDFDYLLDESRLPEIRENIQRRKQVGDIDAVRRLWAALLPLVHGKQEAANAVELQRLWDEFYAEAMKIPNRSHPDTPVGDEGNAKTVHVHGVKKKANFRVRKAEELALKFHLLRADVAQSCSDRAYFLCGQLAIIEQTLVRIALNQLLKNGFQLISVPDVISTAVAASCGLMNRTEKNIAYTLKKHPNFCLSGTAEMGICSFLENHHFRFEQLPQRYVAFSRCFRPEATSGNLAGGLYRVHEFTKVEMFCVTADEIGNESEHALEELVEFQKNFFASLNLHFRILDMPTEELGAPAYRKFDIEAWMPGRKSYGEVSSASNCTDFQSRRLGIKYTAPDGKEKFVHTVNGTAVAVPRVLIALLEQHQWLHGKVDVPKVVLDSLGHLKEMYNVREPLVLKPINPKTTF